MIFHVAKQHFMLKQGCFLLLLLFCLLLYFPFKVLTCIHKLEQHKKQYCCCVYVCQNQHFLTHFYTYWEKLTHYCESKGIGKRVCVCVMWENHWEMLCFCLFAKSMNFPIYVVYVDVYVCNTVRFVITVLQEQD